MYLNDKNETTAQAIAFAIVCIAPTNDAETPTLDKINEKTAFNRENKVKEPKDTISTDKSSLIDKKEKKKKEDNSNSIVKSAAHGYQKGINAANSNANFLKTIYNAYKEEKNKNKSYF